MTRSTTVLRRGLIAALAVVAAAAGPLPQTAHADPAAPAEATIAPSTKAGPLGYPVVAADASGYLLRSNTETGASAYAWYADDGSLVRDFGALDVAPRATGLGDGSTLLWAVSRDGLRIETFDPGTGARNDYALPGGLRPIRVLPLSNGWTIAAANPPSSGSGDTVDQTLHLLDPRPGGGFTDRTLTGLSGASSTGENGWWAVPGAAVMLFTQADGTRVTGLIDTDSGRVVASAQTSLAARTPVISREFFGWMSGNTVQLRPLADPQAAPRVLTLPGAANDLHRLVLTGTALLDEVSPPSGRSTVYSIPLDDGPATVPLAGGASLRPSGDGGALVNLVEDQVAAATYKVPAQGGAPALLYRLPTYQPEDVGLSLARGTLLRAETGAGAQVTAHIDGEAFGSGAAPVASQMFFDTEVPDTSIPRCGPSLRCLPLADGGAAGAALAAFVTRSASGDVVQGAEGGVTVTGSHDGRIVSASGPLAVYDSGSDGQQYVIDLAQHKILTTRPIIAAALWGGTLFSATGANGQVSTADAATSTVRGTVATGAPCAPGELQALGRWLYWSCGTDGPAGVWDANSGKSVPVPAGHALLGDGYVLRHAGDQLVLTDVHTGTPAADRVVATLPAGAYPDDRDITWTLDKFGDFLAYTDPHGTTHVLASGVPHSPIAVLDSVVPATAESAGTGWQPQWTLTAGAAWQLDVRRKGATKVVWSDLSTTTGVVSTTWDGRSSQHQPLPSGDYTWTLTLKAADGQPGATTATGTVTLDSPAARRDYDGDAVGDLLAVNSAGGIDVRPGTGTGSVGATTLKSTSWPAGSTLVPIDDLDGNHVNDLLVRDASGHLTRYDGAVGKAPAASLPHHLIGAGWNIYNLLTSPGDMNGDGHPDLVARDTSGNLYLYKGTASGVFAPRVNIGHGYQIYDTIFGIPDNDAQYPVVDLFARDKSGVLWRYEAAAPGGYMNVRERVGSGWNVYDAIVGVGDINGDGHDDLIARDHNGDLWRYLGKGNRQLAPRVKIGWAWQTYKSLL
ncbi:FG-GAP repeat domain-containing protein [Actinacidiphila acidipaludis]|uniref:VCBS repeat-containing protein n=1 Tax=Actinacidiphila acidipaludis TaxID=2873382 RepID=A0ABS7QBJ0_9ACTN|nr:VCBS repeat-containing protein [Streptomyces acidipaludis]MBY8879810.1 VCBS repeat-containing protein [Streptomyces acidipaludis]